MEGSGESIDSSRVREVGVSQGRSNQFGSVCGHVSSFVVTVDGEVSSDALSHSKAIISHHVSVVSGHIEVGVRFDEFSIEIVVSVDDGSKFGEFGDEVQGVFEARFPVFRFVDSSLVGSREVTVGLKVKDSGG